MPKSKPVILIATTERWHPTARLVMAMAHAGCLVHAVCPSRHPIIKTSAAQQIHAYRGLAPIASFARAIELSRPDLVMPGDDLATRHLHELYRRERGKGGSTLCLLIERSLGSADSFAVVYARAKSMEVAERTGARVPATAVINNCDELSQWVKRAGLPTVLKANGTSGGDGVRLVRSLAEAENAFRELRRPPRLARAFKRALIDSDMTLLAPSIARRRPTVNAQVFIAGREATSAVACMDGKVLASLHFEVIQKVRSTGHATVLRRIDNEEMKTASEKVVRHLRLSGLHGFDFMLESASGKAYLIELNPRATQVGHLNLGPGRNIPAALTAAMEGREMEFSEPVTDNDTIALFPQEWLRDATSPFLSSAYHDVPWSMPEFVEAVRNGRPLAGQAATESSASAAAMLGTRQSWGASGTLDYRAE
jgi:hypothetical protein